MEQTKRLVMTFKTTDDKKVSLSVDNPREDITESEIKDAMDLVVSKNNWTYFVWVSVALVKKYSKWAELVSKKSLIKLVVFINGNEVWRIILLIYIFPISYLISL